MPALGLGLLLTVALGWPPVPQLGGSPVAVLVAVTVGAWSPSPSSPAGP